MGVFERILEARERNPPLARSQVLPLLEQYLTTLQEVASYVDGL